MGSIFSYDLSSNDWTDLTNGGISDYSLYGDTVVFPTDGGIRSYNFVSKSWQKHTFAGIQWIEHLDIWGTKVVFSGGPPTNLYVADIENNVFNSLADRLDESLPNGVNLSLPVIYDDTIAFQDHTTIPLYKLWVCKLKDAEKQ